MREGDGSLVVKDKREKEKMIRLREKQRESDEAIKLSSKQHTCLFVSLAP